MLSYYTLNWHSHRLVDRLVHGATLGFELLKGCQTICFVYTSKTPQISKVADTVFIVLLNMNYGNGVKLNAAECASDCAIC